MLNGRRLIIDTMSEVYEELLPYRDHEFWNFSEHHPIPDSIYIVGRQQVVENTEKFRSLSRDPRYTMIFDNSAEGSSTFVLQLQRMRLDDLAIEKKLLLISGGEMESRYPYILHDHFLRRILDYDENLDVISRSQVIFDKLDKPYKFLFLNGRARPHRKYLWERFSEIGLIDQSIWTMLDNNPTPSRHFDLIKNGKDVMSTSTPIRHLDPMYEVKLFENPDIPSISLEKTFIKNELFNNLWGEIYLRLEPYADTYFSVVTETVFDYPFSFRTEKIAKPLAIGHPWIVASNAGFYRDIRNLGFRTFDGIIDESFDNLDNHQDRMDRIVKIVEDLCRQDLVGFLAACKDICKYNQQHLAEISQQIKNQFPDRFQKFLEEHE